MSHHARAKRRARRIVGAVLGTLALAGGAASGAEAQDLPVTSGDPRIGLPGGLDQPGVALGLQHLANRPKPAAVNGTNSDLAFQGDYAFNGNYNGIHIYNIADPANPTLVTAVNCPGSQNDISVYKNLLFLSVESTAAKKDCTTTPAADAGDALPRHPHLRHLRPPGPMQVAQVQTCRGSHTHTLVRAEERPGERLHLRPGRGRRARADGDGGLQPVHRRDHREPINVADRGHQGPGRQPDTRRRSSASRACSRTRRPARSTASRTARCAKHPCTFGREGGGCPRSADAEQLVRARTPTTATTSPSTSRSTWPPAPARATAC